MKVGYLAPSVDGQAAAIAEAISIAEIEPETVSYIEAHGTGTPVGDPIEVAALTQAYRPRSATKPPRAHRCAIGSVKTNIGHTDNAAGVAGVIKVVKALQHRQLPPSLHFERPNPVIDFASSPFHVNDRLTEWRTPRGVPRRAAVNSLGVGGTNAHLILEEAPPSGPAGPSRAAQLLLLSARSAAAVDEATGRLAGHLAEHPDAVLADVAHTLRVGRRAFAHRRMLVCTSAEDARAALETRDPTRLFTHAAPERRPSVTFMFPGGGAQYAGMGRELYAGEPVFRAEVDRCLALLRDKVDFDLLPLLFPPPDRVDAAGAELERPTRTIPALFIVEVALAKLWMSWGLVPGAMLGHSMGEYAAAYLAGVFTLDQALSLVVLRGKVFEKALPGAMTSVGLPAEELVPLLGTELSLAAVNGPSLCVASGPIEAIARLEQLLESRGVDSRRIKISVAAHSAMLDPVLPEFRALLRTSELSPPAIPFLSNVSGTWITAEEATDPEYWVRHLRSTVRFADCLTVAMEERERVFLEVGPGRTLGIFARAHAAAGPTRTVLSSLRHPSEDVSDQAFVLGVLGRLWLAGVEVDWEAFVAEETRRRIPLPTYPWEHQRYWIEPGRPERARGAVADADERQALKKRADLASWFYRPGWKRTILPAPPADAPPGRWLVFKPPGDGGLAERLVATLRARNDQVVTASPGAGFARTAEHAFTLRPSSAADMDALLDELARASLYPRRILHLWNVLPEGDPPRGHDALQELGFFSLLSLAQAIAKTDPSAPVHLGIVANGLQQVAGEKILAPERATLLGPSKVMMQELPQVTCRSIDIDLPPGGSWQERLVVDQLIRELDVAPADDVIAYRAHDRLVQIFEPAPFGAAAQGHTRLREGGVYLVTGGVGGIGLALAEHLARTRRARLILVGRTRLPARAEWSAWLDGHDLDDPTSRKLRRLLAMEEAGAEVLVVSADVTNEAEVAALVTAGRARFGAIHGVFHTAGVLDDGVIQLKTAQAAAAVLAPKVKGTLALDAALGAAELDFFLLFSSVSAISGLAGQVDYAAANAFLDVFAHARMARSGAHTVAVSWNVWQEVGMAAELGLELGLTRRAPEQPPGRATGHPLLERCVRDGASERIYSTLIDTARHWLVDEHRLKGGDALIPGTGYLELARAAFEEGGGKNPDGLLELRDVMFLAPFAVKDGEQRELRVTLGGSGSTREVTVSGPGAAGSGWETNARATIGYVPRPAAPPRVELEAIAARCDRREERSQGALQDAHLDFGPRWANRARVRFGASEALLELELPAAFAPDLEELVLHPAILDVATAGAQALCPGVEARGDFYVPMSYGSLKIFRPLPRKLASHVRYTGSGSDAGDVASYDVTLHDEQGETLVEIREFVMRKVTDKARMAGATRAPVAAAATANKILELGLREGITPAEGMEALERILAGPIVPQLVVSSQDLDALRARTRRVDPDAGQAPAGEGAAQAATSSRAPRPGLPTAYLAPASELEKTIAAVWEETLFIDGIGLHDDFFDLGGHSLLLTQIVSRLRKRTRTDISLRSLFERRTVAGLAAEIEQARASGTSGDGPALVPRARSAGAPPPPASFAQQRLWFLDRLEPGTAVYNIPQALRLRGPLAAPLLERALGEIARRHESLRTTFAAVDGAPVQLVAAPGPVELTRIDLRDRPAEERVSEGTRLAAEEARRPFDLERGPLFRALLIVLDADDHLLVLNVHHAICDGWSLAVLFQELSVILPAFAAGKPCPLPDLPVQYADYTSWQAACFEGERLDKELSFWKAQLGGELPVLELPSDRPRPATPSVRGGCERFQLSEELTQALGGLARKEGGSLFMILLAAFKTFLYRMSGQEDLLVGSPIANRDRAEIERAIGFFTNTVVFRTSLSGEPTFRELVARVREVALGVLAHQDVPLEKIVEAVHPHRAMGWNPLFQVMFAMQKAPESALDLPGIAAELVDVHSGTTKFDLLLEMQETRTGMLCFLEYSADLFDADTARRMVERFTTLLQAVARDPDRRISEVSLLSDEERRLLLEEWNATDADYPRDVCVQDLVTAQAARTPDDVAVDFEGATLAYRDLDRRSSLLAHHLKALGLGPGVLCGVFLERSLDMVVGLLGILKAGGAYLPLDPSYPQDRVGFMLTDARAPLILTQEALLEELPSIGLEERGVKIVCIDRDWDEIARGPAGDPVSGVSPEHLAYTIYTSGSTGRPKGVQVHHRALVNLLMSVLREPGLTAADRLLAVTTLSFDIAGVDMWLPLIVGARIVLASRELATDGARLLETIQSAGITVMQATPATWRLLLGAGWEGRSSLKVISTGEALPAMLASQLLERTPELWNLYGPTETTIWSTGTRVTDASRITIGRPIANTQVYILDRHLAPVPIGVPGELYIGGDGVALGYLDRPELTSERFVPDPFRPGARMYRTGDVARYQPDGSIDFRNRNDNQVKVRGFRIELGEIEAVLAQHEAIRQAVVVVRDDPSGDKKIVAYVVYRPGNEPTASELRRFVREKLPDYMVPNHIAELATMPLTQNGKIDRRALPDPFADGGARREEHLPPRTPTEEIVAEVWREVLSVERVGRHDNFFEIGGHSLLSMQAVARLERRTGSRLNPRSMLLQNLEQIAAELERGAPDLAAARPDPAPDELRTPPHQGEKSVTRRLFDALKGKVFRP